MIVPRHEQSVPRTLGGGLSISYPSAAMRLGGGAALAGRSQVRGVAIASLALVAGAIFAIVPSAVGAAGPTPFTKPLVIPKVLTGSNITLTATPGRHPDPAGREDADVDLQRVLSRTHDPPARRANHDG